MAVFLDAANWRLHTTFVHYIEVWPFMLIPLAWLGDFSRRVKGLSGVLALLLIIQYVTVWMPRTLVIVIHPVNALFIFWVSMAAVRLSWKQRSSPRADGSETAAD